VLFSDVIAYVAAENDAVWIGLNDINTEGSFVWVNGDLLDSDIEWRTGQPDNWRGDEDCVLLNSPGGVNDIGCSTHNAHALCEKTFLLNV